MVWHTQGAGKSIEMACLSGKLLTDPRMENPTLLIVTDRQDLDGQLFGVFAGAGDLLGESPNQANSRQELRDLLGNRPSGGIIFTTIQKFATESDEDKKNLAVELLQRLLRDEVQTRFKTNVVKQKRFSELLQASLNKYANRSIEAAQVIEELIAMAKQFRDEAERVDAMGLSVAEVAFYDSLANNQAAQDLMGDEVLMKMARELAEKLRVCGKTASIAAFLPPARAGRADLRVSAAQVTCCTDFGALALS